MIKYILHGGRTKLTPEQSAKFVFELTTFPETRKNLTITLCYYSREESRWAGEFAEDQEEIHKYYTAPITIQIASKNTEEFLEQIKQSDVVHFAGGTYNMLYDKIKPLNLTPKEFEGKTVSGSSAGAFLICKYSLNSFSEQPQDINPGLGLIQASYLAHFNIEQNKSEKITKLFNNAHDLPIFSNAEGEFNVIYTNQ